MIIARAFSIALDILLPRSCALCGSPLPPGSLAPWPLCRECAFELRPRASERCRSCGLPLISEKELCMRCRGAERAFDSIYPLFSYSGPARELMTAYKKMRRRSLAPFIAEMFAQAIEARWAERVIIPVPPRPGKARASGWDQVEEIARILQRRGLRVARPLERLRSEEQKSLGRGARALNARKAYALRAGAASPGLPLLIDDVVTTCSTLDSCARALKEGGAISVAALVFAAD
jgi:ComF family protein